MKKGQNLGEKNPMYGKPNKWGHHTKEAKRKISLANKGRIKSEEERKNISDKAKLRVIGSGNPNWRGGHSKCKECGKETSRRNRKRCINCSLKFRKGENNGGWKGGISKKEYKIRAQEKIAGRKKPNQCEICGSMDKISFDHDHETGKFRGWICRRCNLTIGLVKDNKELLSAIIRYLLKND